MAVQALPGTFRQRILCSRNCYLGDSKLFAILSSGKQPSMAIRYSTDQVAGAARWRVRYAWPFQVAMTRRPQPRSSSRWPLQTRRAHRASGRDYLPSTGLPALYTIIHLRRGRVAVGFARIAPAYTPYWCVTKRSDAFHYHATLDLLGSGPSRISYFCLHTFDRSALGCPSVQMYSYADPSSLNDRLFAYLSDIAETTGGVHQANGTECSGEVLMNPLGLRERHDNTAPSCCSMPCSS